MKLTPTAWFSTRATIRETSSLALSKYNKITNQLTLLKLNYNAVVCLLHTSQSVKCQFVILQGSCARLYLPVGGRNLLASAPKRVPNPT